MPLVQLSAPKGTSSLVRRALADAVHRALVDAIGIPEDDRFQLVLESGDRIYDRHYLGVERTDETIFVHITLVRGRTPAQKQALYQRIVANLKTEAGVRPEDVVITLVENAPVDWSVGNGEAQLLRSS
jgi:phenylpyruvate tautomerase PptA (4-oxalocrotonate tautomerase family)